MKTYIGVDLAWSGNKNTGIAIFQWNGENLNITVTKAPNFQDVKDILTPFVNNAKEHLIIGWDAPIIRTNWGTRDSIDAKVSSLYMKFGVGAHTAKLTNKRVSDNGKTTIGFDLAKGWNLNCMPILTNRNFVEVYPHLTIIGLAPNDSNPKINYKKGKVNNKIIGFDSVINRIELKFINNFKSTNWNEIVNYLRSSLRASGPGAPESRKTTEDMVDAILSAITVFIWDNGPYSVGYEEIGPCIPIISRDGGYMIAPVHNQIDRNLIGV